MRLQGKSTFLVIVYIRFLQASQTQSFIINFQFFLVFVSSQSYFFFVSGHLTLLLHTFFFVFLSSELVFFTIFHLPFYCSTFSPYYSAIITFLTLLYHHSAIRYRWHILLRWFFLHIHLLFSFLLLIFLGFNAHHFLGL